MPIRPQDRELEETARKAFAFISSGSAPAMLHSQYSPENFGDAMVELLGDDVSVRVFRDKGQILIELGPAHSYAWFGEDVVLEFIGRPFKPPSFEDERTLEDSARVIQENLATIAKSFSRTNWKATRADLEARLEQRGQALIERLSGRSDDAV